MPTDPTIPESCSSGRKLEVDACESVNAVVSADTCPGIEHTPSKRDADIEATTSHPRGPKRPSTSTEAYDLLFDSNQPIAIGDYLIEHKIGQGGMGAVFRAKQMNLDREVALKVLARHLLDDDKFIHRFKREATVMAKLDHPNIVCCYDCGEEHGVHYLAMEYVDGGSLQTLLDTHRKFSIGDALFVAIQVADALRYAHDLTMVHRDIKPDNVLITKQGVIKLADLGLAKPINDDLSMTASGVGAGTPTFMAPEQMRSAKEVDGRADIYALGAMLYLMLTGQTPFEGENLVKLLEAKEKGRMTSMRKLNKQIPAKLESIVEKMLAKSLTVRYQSCAEVLEDLCSLGLAHDQFSLFHPSTRPASVPKTASKPAMPASKPTPSSKPAPSSKPTPSSKAGPGSKPIPSSKPGTKDPVSLPAPPSGWWYLDAGITAEGKRRVRKFTEEQIHELIKTGHFDSNTEVSRQPGTGYRTLATYQEFELLFRAPAAKRKIDSKTEKLQDEYAKSASETKSSVWNNWKNRLFAGNRNWIVLLGGLMLLGILAYLLILYVRNFIAR